MKYESASFRLNVTPGIWVEIHIHGSDNEREAVEPHQVRDAARYLDWLVVAIQRVQRRADREQRKYRGPVEAVS